MRCSYRVLGDGPVVGMFMVAQREALLVNVIIAITREQVFFTASVMVYSQKRVWSTLDNRVRAIADVLLRALFKAWNFLTLIKPDSLKPERPDITW